MKEKKGYFYSKNIFKIGIQKKQDVDEMRGKKQRNKSEKETGRIALEF